MDKAGIHMARTTIDRVAEAFLSLDAMTPKKLQKLCYYAYSWYLTLYKEHLFPNRFEAWIHGPVDPGLYHEYKDYGWQEIPQHEGPLAVPDDVYEFVQEVFAAYGDMNGDELEYLTHSEDPWKKARGGLSAYAPCKERISDEDIIEFYGRELDGQD